jgi:integrase
LIICMIESRTVAPRNAKSYDGIPRISRIVRDLKKGIMAYFRKQKNGWRAEVETQGVRKSKIHPTKAHAQAWATAEEAAIIKGASTSYPDKTLADALDKYADTVSIKKRSCRSEQMRFTAMKRDFPALCGKALHKITPADIGEWRDERRKTVADSSVVREACSLKNLWNVAREEWGWCGDSPWKKAKMPKKAHARTRQTSGNEIYRLVRSMGYVTGQKPATMQQEVAYAYLVAHHTAMRAGELLSLRKSTVDLNRRVITLSHHKTVHEVGTRFVPFTKRALRLLKLLDGWTTDKYFTVDSASLDTLYRKVRDRLMIDNLRFHDSRAAALTRLSKRMDVLRLAKISGHKDLNQLMDAYYRQTAADIALTI